MWSRELPESTFAVRFPKNNCTPQNVRQPIRFKRSTAFDGFNAWFKMLLFNANIIPEHHKQIVAYHIDVMLLHDVIVYSY